VAGARAEATRAERIPVSIVIPCFNEELILPDLANTLENLERSLGSAYDFRYVFVDDGRTGHCPRLRRRSGIDTAAPSFGTGRTAASPPRF
jgi:hypothetical protein